MKSATTSVRLPEELRLRLEECSEKLHRKKNWIVTQALREYLAQPDKGSLRQEAKRQSLLAVSLDPEATSWQDNADTVGWQ